VKIVEPGIVAGGENLPFRGEGEGEEGKERKEQPSSPFFSSSFLPRRHFSTGIRSLNFPRASQKIFKRPCVEQ